MAVRRLAPPELQPQGFSFTMENLEWAKGQIAKYPEGRQASAVIPILWRAQEQSGGWLPEKAIEHVAHLLGMPKIRVLEVATFYTMFNLEPVGKFHVQLCGTTPCVLRGADKLLKLCHDRIGEQQHVTADGTCVDEAMFAEGYAFDGSSIAGWKGIEASDMTLMPDPASAHIDPFFAQTTMAIFCDVLEPSTGEMYERDPRSIAKRAEALGMRVLPFDVVPQPGLVDFDTILKESDIITLHVPLTPETKNMIGAKELKMMKPTAILINTARGGLVDEEALAQALRDGTIAGAGFDVLTKEPPKDGNVLLDPTLPNFILTPHVAWASQEAMQILADQLIDNIEAFVAGKPQNVVE